jgi:hypothetical protein
MIIVLITLVNKKRITIQVIYNHLFRSSNWNWSIETDGWCLQMSLRGVAVACRACRTVDVLL